MVGLGDNGVRCCKNEGWPVLMAASGQAGVIINLDTGLASW
jgi:hypothetical protein